MIMLVCQDRCFACGATLPKKFTAEQDYAFCSTRCRDGLLSQLRVTRHANESDYGDSGRLVVE